VGIGTSAPADQVHLSSTGSNRIFVESVSASLTAFAGIRQRTALREYFSGVNLGNTWTVFDNTAGAARLTILPDGKVGIGRPPAANIFEVEGTASKSAAGDWLANSDARIKKKVETIGSALATIDKVRLVSFEYTDEYRAAHPSIEARSYMNVIAQEFAEVFPDHVKGSGEKVPGSDDEVLQVDPYPLTIYSAAAIQELHAMLRAKDAQLADQGARLADQGTQLADQGARLAALEAVVSENLIQRKGK